MASSQRTNRHPGARPRPAGLAVVMVLAVAALLDARVAGAHLDLAKESGIVQLDSATAVAEGASPQNWRHADPLALPDVFGPGAVLSVGNVRMKVINNGTLGNPNSNTSADPAGQWPGSSGVEYLFAIMFGVGAVNPSATDPNAIRRVSYYREWRPPTLDPVDRIYRAFDGIINGTRFYNDDHDKDSEGHDIVDEDFLDGRDNDGDGKIDEDHAALGQQEFSYTMRDDTREAVNTTFNEKHVPIGLEAHVRAWAYSLQGLTDFNVCEYQVTNVSGHALDSLCIGWTVDMDAGPIILAPFWTDDIDYPQYPQGEFVYRVGSAVGDLQDAPRAQFNHDGQINNQFPRDSALCPRVKLRVNAFSIGDQDGDLGRTPGMGTFMLIDHTVDPTGINGPRRVGFHSFRADGANSPYSQGGLPRLDAERFESMVSGEFVDPQTGFITAEQGSGRGDYAAWCSIGPWRHVQPGQTISATVAFGVKPATAQLVGQYPTDYARYLAGNLTGADLAGKYPALENALAAQVAFEGVHEYNQAYPETQPISEGGRDYHGRETGIRLPLGTPPTTIIENCRGEQREVIVTDRQYSWFDFDCDYCTGVWNFAMPNLPAKTGLFHKTWNASAPPPNPNTDTSPLYNATDNPGRRIVASGDRAIRLGWDNVSETTPDSKTGWLDFRGYSIWKVADWTRPVGSAGPNESDWRLLGEFRIFDYWTGVTFADVPYERNYTRDPGTGAKICPQVFVPNLYNPATQLYGKTVPICLDRFDLWNKQSGEILKPDWTTPCLYDTAGLRVPFEINSGDLEYGGPLTGGVFDHVFQKAGTYNYMCMRHPQQKGTVVVAVNEADSAVVQIVDASPAGFSPALVSIRPGGHVRWVNVSGQNHAIQTDRDCKIANGVIVHRPENSGNPRDRDDRVQYAIGRYQYIDHEVKNGFLYFYAITAFDSTYNKSITSELGGRRSAVEAEGVVPETRTDANGEKGVWVVPNPYRGYARLQDRPSSWDLTPNASDPTGTHIDFLGLPRGNWTIRVYTVAGDLVQTIRATDPVNESIRQPVLVPNPNFNPSEPADQPGPGGTVINPRNITVAGYNRQQDSPNDGQARWNLISRNGQDIVSGIYLFTVESSEGTQRGKFVVIR